MKITCANCGANLQAKDEFAGKKAKCPKCGIAIDVPAPPSPTKPIPFATERQKEYALELDIEFPPDINRREISKLIDAAVQKRDGERFEQLAELSNRESDAWRQMREEVLREIDEEDCRLSVAEPTQMLDELANRNRGAILISFDLDDIESFENLTNVDFAISSTDDMTEIEMRSVLIALGFESFKRSKK